MFAAMSAPAKTYIGRRGMGVATALLQLVAAVAVAGAVVLPLNQLTQPGGSVVVTLTGQDPDRPLDVAGLPDGVSITDPAPQAELQAFDLPAGLRALTELPISLGAVAAALGAWLLARVVSTVADGRPFDRRNPRRLAGLAAAVVLGGLVVPLSEGMVTTAVLEHLDLTGPGSPVATFAVEFPLTPVVVGLALLAAAEAFRRGGALEAEVEGMV
jgi:Protein of unknown function (DUF2975)